MSVTPNKNDPTQTEQLREQFMVAMRRRFAVVRRAVEDLIAKQDVFSLTTGDDGTIVQNAKFEFSTDAAKVEAFRDWLRQVIDAKILSVDPRDRSRPWLATYIDSAYRKGLNRAYIDAKPERYVEPAGFYAGAKSEFLRAAFDAPEATRKLELLYTRSFTLLQGVTDRMASQLSVELADGIANGHSPIDIARRMAATIDGLTRSRAELLARTEIIHAHAEGQLDAFDRLGIESIGVMAEWRTAGDGRVCRRCSAMEGKVFTTAQARGLIPLHPNCRCAFAPSTHPVIVRDVRNRRRRSREMQSG